MCRTSTQRIRTNTNVEYHLLLYYFNCKGRATGAGTLAVSPMSGTERENVASPKTSCGEREIQSPRAHRPIRDLFPLPGEMTFVQQKETDADGGGEREKEEGAAAARRKGNLRFCCPLLLLLFFLSCFSCFAVDGGGGRFNLPVAADAAGR